MKFKYMFLLIPLLVFVMHEGVLAAGTAYKTKVSEQEMQMSDKKRGYVRASLRLHDVDSEYRDHPVDGRIPVVFGKVENTGDRRLRKVRIKTSFFDGLGNTIFESYYLPVDGNRQAAFDPPLEPDETRDFAYTTLLVPGTWAAGASRSRVTYIEFVDE